MNTKERMTWVDVVKGIGIFLMVLGHASIPDLLKVWIYGFHMPLFFIIAGYLFDLSKWKERGIYELIRNRAKAYLVPYTIFFVVNLICWIALNVFSGRGVEIKSIVIWILAGLWSHDVMMPNCAPLWFLTCLFVTYILFWLLLLVNGIKRILLCLVYCVTLILICIFEKKIGLTQLPWHIDVAFFGSIFMLFGNYLRKYLDCLDVKMPRICHMINFFAASAVIMFNGQINMVQNQYRNPILFFVSASICSYEIIVAVKKCKHKENYAWRILGFWGRNSIIFIGVNYLINVIVRQGFKMVGLEWNITYSIVDTIVVMLGCSMLALIWNRSREYFKSENRKV